MVMSLGGGQELAFDAHYRHSPDGTSSCDISALCAALSLGGLSVITGWFRPDPSNVAPVVGTLTWVHHTHRSLWCEMYLV
jgi:hypothetical protein